MGRVLQDVAGKETGAKSCFVPRKPRILLDKELCDARSVNISEFNLNFNFQFNGLGK